MRNLSFEKTLGEATEQQDKIYSVTLKSKKTGNPYTTSAFDIETIILGKPEKKEKEQDDGTKVTVYSYQIFDAPHDLGYRIEVPKLVPTGTYTKAIFRQVTGGSTGSGYWMHAKDIEIVNKSK